MNENNSLEKVSDKSHFIFNLMKEKYDSEEERFNLLDKKAYNFFNISVVDLTIQISFFSSTVINFITNNDFIVYEKIIFIIVYLTNIISNVMAIYYFYQSYKIGDYATALKPTTISKFYFEDDLNLENIVNKTIVSMEDTIKENKSKLKEKEDNIEKGSKLLLNSILFLIITIIYYLFLTLVIYYG